MTGPIDGRAVQDALDLLGLKWSAPILRTLAAEGPLRYSEIQTELEEISDNSLTRTLDRMRETGVLDLRLLSRSPRVVEYELSDAGRELVTVLEEVERWANTHLEDGAPTVVVADRHRRLLELYTTWLEPAFNVVPAPDWDAFVVTLEEDPDAVVIDPDLPGLDPEVDMVHIHERLPTVVVIGDLRGQDTSDIPADVIVQKPLQAPELTEAVTTVIEADGTEIADGTD